ncbi:MAG: hypothetical protein V4733_07740 [Verrucomicrobiota bacterium]
MKSRLIIFSFLLIAVAIFVWTKDQADQSADRKPQTTEEPDVAGSRSDSERFNARRSERAKAGLADEGDAKKEETTPVAPALAPPVEKMAAVDAPPAGARVTVEGKSYDLVPNQFGEFQRVYVEKGGEAEVTVRYPEAKADDVVIAAMQDGGTIDAEGVGKALRLDKSLKLHFTAQTTAEGGISRILLTKGADRKTVELWGGEEPPLKSEVK